MAEEESRRQTRLLTEEIVAHERTDQALQQARAGRGRQRRQEPVSDWNQPRGRFAPNAILGYAQLMENDDSVPPIARKLWAIAAAANTWRI